jgi:hypothetical protein
MSELEIPERAWAVTDALCCCRYHSGVFNAAPIIVAAELRRLAGTFWRKTNASASQDLMNRADDLDPEGKHAR